jgi:hypothetical protein
MRLLSLIDMVKPDMYFELHSYSLSSYERMTSPQRMEIEGVPPLVELERGVLKGSVSPILRNILYDAHPNPPESFFMLELPIDMKESEEIAVEILVAGLTSNTRLEFVKYLERNYPEQTLVGKELFERFAKKVGLGGEYP